MEQKLLNIKEAASILGISRFTLSDMLKKHEIPFIPFRGKLKAKRISREAIDRYIKDHTVTNREELRREIDGRRK